MSQILRARVHLKVAKFKLPFHNNFTPEFCNQEGNSRDLWEREIMLFIGQPMGRSIMISKEISRNGISGDLWENTCKTRLSLTGPKDAC